MIDPSKLMDMMKNAQEMQQRMQDELATKNVDGTAGGGMVTVTLNGMLQVQRVKIEPSCVDKNDVALLEDLVRAAVQQAIGKAEALRVDNARSMASSFGLPPGMM
jgi:nucleoid-associated protein EbfC